MNQEDAVKYLISNPNCFDRFSFDKYMRMLLIADYTHDEAKDLILTFCHLSNLVFQERLENKYYLRINLDKLISDDLNKLIEKTEKDFLHNKISEAIKIYYLRKKL